MLEQVAMTDKWAALPYEILTAMVSHMVLQCFITVCYECNHLHMGKHTGLGTWAFMILMIITLSSIFKVKCIF